MKKHLHERRGISLAELGALLGTRELIARGYLKHRAAPYTGGTWSNLDFDKLAGRVGSEHVFNMGIACKTNTSCGSVQCIGGTMGWLMGKTTAEADMYVHSVNGYADLPGGPPLANLFYPPNYVSASRRSQRYQGYNTITSKQALQAIDNWLKFGQPKWHKILKLDKDMPRTKRRTKANI